MLYLYKYFMEKGEKRRKIKKGEKSRNTIGKEKRINSRSQTKENDLVITEYFFEFYGYFHLTEKFEEYF